jgi:hypothetical protein
MKLINRGTLTKYVTLPIVGLGIILGVGTVLVGCDEVKSRQVLCEEVGGDWYPKRYSWFPSEEGDCYARTGPRG